MLFLHKGPKNVPAWTLLVRGRWYVLAPTVYRPGGPVIFTDPLAADKWLEWQASKGMAIQGAQVSAGEGDLEECIQIWRGLFEGLGYQPQHYSVCIINPRQAVHPAHDLDAEAIPFDAEILPEGVVVNS